MLGVVAEVLVAVAEVEAMLPVHPLEGLMVEGRIQMEHLQVEQSE